MLSEDGRCKALDSSANGYVRGEAAGALVLQRVDMQQPHGGQGGSGTSPPPPRCVLALIRGSAVNQVTCVTQLLAVETSVT